MGYYNEALGNSAGPIPLTVAGETYSLTRLDGKAKATYEDWLENGTLDAVRYCQRKLDEASYSRLLKATRDEIRSKAYAWGKPLWDESLRTDEGLHMLFWLALQPCHPKLTVEDATRIMGQSYHDDPGGPDRHPEIICTLIDLAYAGKIKLPRKKTTAPTAA